MEQRILERNFKYCPIEARPEEWEGPILQTDEERFDAVALFIAFGLLLGSWACCGWSPLVFFWDVGLLLLFVVARHVIEMILDWFVINEFPPLY